MKNLRILIVFVLIFSMLSLTVFADSPEDYFEGSYSDSAEIEPIFNPFEDVPVSAYYFDAVNWAVAEGVTTGTSATTFSPSATCTRGQVVTFLWRALGSPEPEMKDNAFTDVAESAYYYKAVLWAYENYITNGTTATTFSPNATCTSGQVITFLWRSLGEPSADTGTLPVSERTQYYAGALAWAKENGLLGHSNKAFVANNLSPRADIVTYLYYALN